MKTLVFGLMASLAVGGAYAQTATTPSGTMGGGTAAASGNSNQAVATTNANAPMPAKGANSFTMSEASSRIAKNGFTNVTGLAKDADGVWRGHADKDGTNAAVWLDYKGNVGTN
jgi:putative membrane protein